MASSNYCWSELTFEIAYSDWTQNIEGLLPVPSLRSHAIIGHTSLTPKLSGRNYEMNSPLDAPLHSCSARPNKPHGWQSNEAQFSQGTRSPSHAVRPWIAVSRPGTLYITVIRKAIVSEIQSQKTENTGTPTSATLLTWTVWSPS